MRSSNWVGAGVADPNPFKRRAPPFSQTPSLHEGEIEIRQVTRQSGGAAYLVDANNPVIRWRRQAATSRVVNVSLNNWRLSAANPDRVLAGQTNRTSVSSEQRSGQFQRGI